MDINCVFFDLRSPSAPAEKPLMLHEVMFCPVITWACQELTNCGVQRFFIVCHRQWQEELCRALADTAGVEVFVDENEALSRLEGQVLVIPSPVLPVGALSNTPVYTVDAETLRSHAAQSGGLTTAPQNSSSDLAFLPVRSVSELQRCSSICRDLIVQRLADSGVNIVDPTSTYVDPRCQVGEGVTILPGTILRGRTVIGTGCEIGPNAMIRDCTIGDGTTVNASQLNESTVGSHTTIGPFAYVRPNCTIGDNCRVGDFVEVKNSVIGKGTKISHLTYVGDSDVGEKVNFGCGTVTTNYDGNRKSRCTIGDNVFLGCNTNLVAPVTLGNGSYTAAGSTITEDVPADALAIAREKQVNKEGWAARFRLTWKKK